jgi:ABC-type transport system involved in cytochrome bd biosynthesis fused ATPase/permease subunit
MQLLTITLLIPPSFVHNNKKQQEKLTKTTTTSRDRACVWIKTKPKSKLLKSGEEKVEEDEYYELNKSHQKRRERKIVCKIEVDLIALLQLTKELCKHAFHCYSKETLRLILTFFSYLLNRF